MILFQSYAAVMNVVSCVSIVLFIPGHLAAHRHCIKQVPTYICNAMYENQIIFFDYNLQWRLEDCES